jgi:small subunit ribosomal protein S20
MPIIKSAIKRVRQAAKRRSQNLHVKRQVHRDVRTLEDAIAAGDAKAAVEALREAVSEIDRAVKKGTLHRNTADRRKSSLTKRANPVIGDAKPAAKAKAKPATKTAAKKPAVKKAPAKTTAKK